MSENFSPNEHYRDEEPTEAGSDRAVGSVLMVIGATKAFVAEAVPPTACLIFASGGLLLVLGIFAPVALIQVKQDLVENRHRDCQGGKSHNVDGTFISSDYPHGCCCANTWKTTIAFVTRSDRAHLLDRARATGGRREYEAAVLRGT